MTDYYVHKAVELGKVKKARRQILEQPGYLEQNYIALRKYDGCCGIVFLDKQERQGYMLTRSGEVVRSCQHIIDELLLCYPSIWQGGVVFLEVWQGGKDFAYISGKFRQHAPAPELTYKAWDIVSQYAYDNGKSCVPFVERLDHLRMFVPKQKIAEYYNPGTYGDAMQLARQLVKQGGHDGLILKDPAGTWELGRGSGGESIKVKPSLSFDLRVTGLEEGEGKHAGRTGRLSLSFFGKVLGVGTGLSDQQRAEWWASPASIVGQIVEVEAMGYSKDGSLREPRLKGIRYDKLKADDEQE